MIELVPITPTLTWQGSGDRQAPRGSLASQVSWKLAIKSKLEKKKIEENTWSWTLASTSTHKCACTSTKEHAHRYAAIRGPIHRSSGLYQNEYPGIIADVGCCAWKLRASLETGVHIKESLGNIPSQFPSCGKWALFTVLENLKQTASEAG